VKNLIVRVFCTRGDILHLMSEFSELRFWRAGMFDSESISPLNSLEDDAAMGTTDIGDMNHAPRYLVSDKSNVIKVRPVEQSVGLTKYAVDQVANPDTIVLETGGLFGANCLIAGQLGTASQSQRSVELFDVLRSAVRRRFEKRKEYYLGREAKQLLDRGVRLTANASAPEMYDLH
jgi:hypothetical protein